MLKPTKYKANAGTWACSPPLLVFSPTKYVAIEVVCVLTQRYVFGNVNNVGENTNIGGW